MSEAAIQSGIQAVIQAMPEFRGVDVLINDWVWLYQAEANAPYVLIETADNFVSRQDTTSPDTTWEIPVTLLEKFDDWQASFNNLRTRRQALIDKFNEVGSNRSAGGLEAVTVDVIRSAGPLGFVYDANIPEEMLPEAMPIFISAPMIFEVEDYDG